MIKMKLTSALIIGLAVWLAAGSGPVPALAYSKELASYIGERPTGFETPEAAAAAFRDAMAKDDLPAVAVLLGLDPDKLTKAENITKTLQEIREATAERMSVQPEGDLQVLRLGGQLWPFPFPIVKGSDGKWSFDTIAGLEEIVNRRIGQNELHAIKTARLFVDAQAAYAAEDRDSDGVLEYAQRLVSSEGQMDGLYWPEQQGDGDSPAGAIDPAALDKAKAGDGYFGYNFRILKRQGDNVAGGTHDYVINGNMIAGFALIAWPARYAETGVNTFVVNQAGIVYERDFGPDTANIVAGIKSFNPGDRWQVTKD